MRRDEGVPPYRRLRRESDTMSFRALVEKSPAVETKIIEYDHPKYLPAVAHCLARGGSLPRNRKGNNHTRTLINIVIGRRDNRFPFREIPTVTSFPRNDKLFRRMRRFIWIIILIKTYTRTALSLRGAQSATRQSPGREDGRLVHERYTSIAGDFSAAFGLSSSLRSK